MSRLTLSQLSQFIPYIVSSLHFQEALFKDCLINSYQYYRFLCKFAKTKDTFRNSTFGEALDSKRMVRIY